MQKNATLSTMLDAATAVVVLDVSASAKSDINAGNEEVQNGRWGKAFSAFQTAVRKIKETQDNVYARERLKEKVGLDLNATTTEEVVATTTADENTGDAERDEHHQQ